VRDHHRFLIAKHLLHIDFLDEQLADFDAQIAAHIQAQPPLPPPPPTDGTVAAEGAAAAPAPAATSEGSAVDEPLTWEGAIAIWDGIPGIGRRVAEQLVAELGVDMGQFPSAAHAASWAKLAPGNNVSAGKRYSSTIGKGNQWLRSTLIQAAHAAVKVKDSYLAAFYHRLVARRGVKKAIVAVAHTILTLAYTLLRKREPYRERGAAALHDKSMPPRFTTAPIDSSAHAPLVALGFRVRQPDLWAPIRSRVQFTQPTHTSDPVSALLDLAVGLLAGCEVVAQVNTTIRSDLLLA